MAQGDFKDLIYQSAQVPVGISETNTVDRLLGIGVDGTAKVVSITDNGADGNYKVMVHGDVETNPSQNTGATAKVYSCSAASTLMDNKIQSAIVANSTSEISSDSKTYSCKAINTLIAGAGGGGGDVIVDTTTPASSQGVTDKAFSCKTIYRMVEDAKISVIQASGPASTSNVYSASATSSLINGKVVNDGSATDSDKAFSCAAVRSLVGEAATLWESDANDANAIAPKNSKNIHVPEITCGKSLLMKTTEEDSSSSGPQLILQGHTTGEGQGTHACFPSLLFRMGEASDYQLTLVAGSGFWMNTSLTASAFYESSDISLKTNVRPLSYDNMSAAMGIPLVEFDWKKDGSHSYGTIAQEVEKIMPEIVSVDGNGRKTVNYIALLCAKVAALENEVAYLKTRVQ